MSAIDSGSIDIGPQAVGDRGDVSSVVAIAADRDPIATVAAPQSAEQGRLDLGAPSDGYRPERADKQVADKQVADEEMLEGFDGDEPQLRPPASRAAVEQLIAHDRDRGSVAPIYSNFWPFGPPVALAPDRDFELARYSAT